MENNQNLIEQNPQSSVALLLLKQSPEAQKVLAIEIYHRFHSMKTYGKPPESLESITHIFVKDLADYPLNKILFSIKLHSQRSPEFPTPADIINLIKRNGRPPLKESEIITLRKKDGADKTPEDWAILREWENQQQEGFGTDFVDDQKDSAMLQENIRLRKEVIELKKQYESLSNLLCEEIQAKFPAVREIKLEDKIAQTIEFMKKTGATQDDIDEFMKQYDKVA